MIYFLSKILRFPESKPTFFQISTKIFSKLNTVPFVIRYALYETKRTVQLPFKLYAEFITILRVIPCAEKIIHSFESPSIVDPQWNIHLFLFIYFIKKPKIGEIHVQYMNNLNMTW